MSDAIPDRPAKDADWCEVRILLPSDGKYGPTRWLIQRIVQEAWFRERDWCEWDRPDGATLSIAPVRKSDA